MKLWRKLAKKTRNKFGEETNRNGRQVRYEYFVTEQMMKSRPKTYPLLDALIQKSGIKFVMSKKEEAKLKQMIEEATNETK